MEPSKEVQICLPRFASNRHGSELPGACTDRIRKGGPEKAVWSKPKGEQLIGLTSL
jgi:hypothetical protein